MAAFAHTKRGTSMSENTDPAASGDRIHVADTASMAVFLSQAAMKWAVQSYNLKPWLEWIRRTQIEADIAPENVDNILRVSQDEAGDYMAVAATLLASGLMLQNTLDAAMADLTARIASNSPFGGMAGMFGLSVTDVEGEPPVDTGTTDPVE